MKPKITEYYTVIDIDPNVIPVSPALAHAIKDIPENQLKFFFEQIRSKQYSTFRGATTLEFCQGKLRAVDELEALFTSIKQERLK